MKKYPRIANWLVWKKNPDGSYQVKDCLSGDTYQLGSHIAHFAKKLNGKRNPFTVCPDSDRQEVRQMLRSLAQNSLLRYNNWMHRELTLFCYTLWCPKYTRARSQLPAFLDTLRMTLWFPFFLAGILAFWKNLPIFSDEPFWPGIVLGSCVGAIAHEISHALSCLHWGGDFFEIGATLQYGIPGMYALIDRSAVHNRLHQAAISSAGIEANLMLSGIFVGMAAIPALQPVSTGLFAAALANFFLAMTNLIPALGIDGMQILSRLLGSGRTYDKAQKILLHKARRRKLLKKGTQGYIVLAACFLLTVQRYILALLLVILSFWEAGILCSCLFS